MQLNSFTKIVGCIAPFLLSKSMSSQMHMIRDNLLFVPFVVPADAIRYSSIEVKVDEEDFAAPSTFLSSKPLKLILQGNESSTWITRAFFENFCLKVKAIILAH